LIKRHQVELSNFCEFLNLSRFTGLLRRHVEGVD